MNTKNEHGVEDRHDQKHWLSNWVFLCVCFGFSIVSFVSSLVCTTSLLQDAVSRVSFVLVSIIIMLSLAKRYKFLPSRGYKIVAILFFLFNAILCVYLVYLGVHESLKLLKYIN
jgi:hypothetical protein